uniref:Uncharacterized protein n=1 Tax=Anguilla anguilla TaxID=7936 RepID=A0A0E9X5I2_ANGAN
MLRYNMKGSRTAIFINPHVHLKLLLFMFLYVYNLICDLCSFILCNMLCRVLFD